MINPLGSRINPFSNIKEALKAIQRAKGAKCEYYVMAKERHNRPLDDGQVGLR